jgi:hypothetical protein
MSDLGKRAVDAPTNTKTLEQTTALRGWLTALLAQTVQAETTLKYRIADLETEAGRLRTHLEQTTSASETLRRSIRTVDEAIGRRFRELHASAAPIIDPNLRRLKANDASRDQRSQCARSGARAGSSHALGMASERAED